MAVHWYLGHREGEPWSPPNSELRSWWRNTDEGRQCLKLLYKAEDRIFAASFRQRLTPRRAVELAGRLCEAYGVSTPDLDIRFRTLRKFEWLHKGHANYLKPCRAIPSGSIRFDFYQRKTISPGFLIHELGHHLRGELLGSHEADHDEPFWSVLESLHDTYEQRASSTVAARARTRRDDVSPEHLC